MALSGDDFRINLNQNLWGLVVAFVSLGVAEYYKLCTLFWFSVVASSVMILSVIVTTFAYTTKYVKNKNNQEAK